MAFVDDVLDEFDGQLRIEDIYNMTYKELGYLREHRAKHHPASKEAKALANALTAPAEPSGAARPSKPNKRRR